MTTALIIGDIQRGITNGYPFARQVAPPLTGLLPRARVAGVLDTGRPRLTGVQVDRGVDDAQAVRADEPQQPALFDKVSCTLR
ncbi:MULTISPECIES: hypothetical protein [unclassified Nonomuraea]|uniref:hypothetical protein n=1 Tax=unclassified Nonomuraea TaxID=2593643 RepID=UPI0033DE337F